MRTPARLSFLIGAAIFVVGLLNGLLSPPDTVNGAVVPWDTLLKALAAVFMAALAWLGSYLGLRFSGARTLPYLTGIIIALLYEAYLYLPTATHYLFHTPAQRVTMHIDRAGHIEGSMAFFWPLLEPLVMAFLLSFAVGRLYVLRSKNGA